MKKYKPAEVDDTEPTPSIGKHGRRALRKAKHGLILSRTFSPKFWEDQDSRYNVVRLIKKRYDTLKADCGGEESIQRDLLCRRATFLSIVLETMETEATEQGTFDVGIYGQALNSMVGILKALGLERRVRKAGGLQVYLAEKESAK